MTIEMQKNEIPQAADEAELVAEGSPLHQRSIVLIGMMGAGKTTVGRKLAVRLGLPFIDSDLEIERAAGKTIKEIFEVHGEPAFRDGERRVIARLLEGGPQVLATGGGAFMNEETRKNIRERAISIWLRADLEVLLRRVARRSTRPLLNRAGGERSQREVMEDLIATRYPVYAEADIVVDSLEGPHETVVDDVVTRLRNFSAAEHRKVQ